MTMECSLVPEISSSEFFESWNQRLEGKRIPLKLTMEVTERCNLRCVHCYINRPASDAQARQREMSLARIADILDQAADLGTLWLLLTGGEPLLRPDLEDIYLYAKRKGFLTTLFTNGTLMTPALADLLAEWPPEIVEITLYGRTRETYEKVTGVPGSYDRCMRGIDLLLDRGVKLGLKTVVMTHNLHEFGEIRRFAEDRDLRFRYDPVIRPRLQDDHKPDPRALRISPEEVVALEEAQPGGGEEWVRLRDKYAHVPASAELYGCNAGIKVAHVDSFGHMRLCMGAVADSFDLAQGEMRDAWNSWAYEVRARTFTKDFACRHCDKAILCGRCPGFAQLENGDPESPVDYMCRIAHLRAEKFWSVPGGESSG
jgi:radical SAM protein with 4Fe4S-binding SPASM domain